MRKSVAVATVLLALAGAACSDDGSPVREIGGSGSGSGSGSGTHSQSPGACEVEGGTTKSETVDLHAELSEYQIELEETNVAAGVVKIEAENEGKEEHEIVVVRADDPADLPTKADGSVDEGPIAEKDLIGEIEAFAPGTECQGSFELTAGKYVLFCNIVETSSHGSHAHVKEGMVTTLTVT